MIFVIVCASTIIYVFCKIFERPKACKYELFYQICHGRKSRYCLIWQLFQKYFEGRNFVLIMLRNDLMIFSFSR